jgi:hypothetical protein
MRGRHACAAGAFVVAVVMLCSGAVFAADVIVGSVLAVRGDVYWVVGGRRQPLTANMPVHSGGTIVSAAGKAKIALDDGTIISVGENTRVRVADHDRASNNSMTRVSLVVGALRLLVAKVTSAGTFEVETETAIAAVRGTDWVIEATSEQTSVAVVTGVVAVSGRDANAQSTVVLDAPGQGTDVRRGSPPTPVAQWGAQRFSATVARATFE